MEIGEERASRAVVVPRQVRPPRNKLGARRTTSERQKMVRHFLKRDLPEGREMIQSEADSSPSKKWGLAPISDMRPDPYPRPM
jgi:hypothetical protein